MYFSASPQKNARLAHIVTLNTKGLVAASCCWSQLIESYFKALIANRLAAKKDFGN